MSDNGYIRCSRHVSGGEDEGGGREIDSSFEVLMDLILLLMLLMLLLLMLLLLLVLLLLLL